MRLSIEYLTTYSCLAQFIDVKVIRTRESESKFTVAAEDFDQAVMLAHQHMNLTFKTTKYKLLSCEQVGSVTIKNGD